ncbi:AAA family ATPase [Pseudomonas syringae]|uniref:AAA family ATPase n=1 Tax=Pseudomonas syringae TaxID=317 RepID=UPI003CF8567C
MFIKSLEYSEAPGDPRSWKVTGLDFGNINLIVGKNASGKSRVISALFGLAQIVSGRIPPRFSSGKWKVIFERTKGQIVEEQLYALELSAGKVVSEAMSIAGRVVMARDDSGKGFVLKKTGSDRVIYKVPVDQLMVVVRRDEIQHPFFEHMHKWGATACCYRFGSDLGKSTLSANLQPLDLAELNISELTDNVGHVFHATAERFGADYKQVLLDDFSELGYFCDDILTTQIANQNSPSLVGFALAVQEKGFGFLTTQGEMSQGMYRALAILIQFNANILWTRSKMVGREPKPGDSPMVIIDDIGEGLDFDRSKLLINLLVKKAKTNSVQLIMSSNDRFIMNVIPLEHWIVLHREDGKVRAFNNANSKDVFEEFDFMGLSNFDFFSGKYFLPEDSV